MRPVEAGTFCRIPHDIKTIMKGTKNYEREGNVSGYSYHDKYHIADTDILYVIDDKALLEKVSEQGLVFVREERNWLNTAKQYLPVYERLTQ